MDLQNQTEVNKNQLTLDGIEPAKTKRKYAKRRPYIKELTKRILHAVGNGLRTSDSIANALNVPKAKIQSNLWHLKDKGLVHGVKKQGQSAHKYYLTTEKPTLDGEPIDITPKKRKYTKRKATKRVVRVGKVAKVEKVVEVESPRKTYVRQLEEQIQRLVQNISNLEVAMSEKEKETWVLESEIHDLKAIIRYLESKLPRGDR